MRKLKWLAPLRLEQNISGVSIYLNEDLHSGLENVTEKVKRCLGLKEWILEPPRTTMVELEDAKPLPPHLRKPLSWFGAEGDFLTPWNQPQ